MLTLNTGEIYIASFVITALGCLSSQKNPHFPGLNDKFKNPVFMTSKYPQDISLDYYKGKRVAIIGTGSSGVQVIPTIAPLTEHLYIVQRTARFVAPAIQKNLTEAEIQNTKSNLAENIANAKCTDYDIYLPNVRISAKTESEEEFNQFLEKLYTKEGGFHCVVPYKDAFVDHESNYRVGEFFRKKIRETVKDPKVAELLCPDKDFLITSHRVSIEDHYYETFNRPNVTLLDVKNSTISFDETSLLINDSPYPIDLLILATGFIPILGSYLNIDIRGVGGLTLAQKWDPIAENFVGLMVPKFPNFFMIHGPGGPNILANMITNTELESDFIMEILQFMKSKNRSLVQPLQASADQWVDYSESVMSKTVIASRKSNYNTNVRGDKGHINTFAVYTQYTSKLQEIRESNFSDFEFM